MHGWPVKGHDGLTSRRALEHGEQQARVGGRKQDACVILHDTPPWVDTVTTVGVSRQSRAWSELVCP